MTEAIRWHLCLIGGLLVLSSSLTKHRAIRNGDLVEFVPVIETGKAVWFSQGFAEDESALFDIMHDAVGSPNSKWRVVEGTIDEYFGLRRRCTAIVTPDEKRTEVVFARSDPPAHPPISQPDRLSAARSLVGLPRHEAGDDIGTIVCFDLRGEMIWT